MNQSARTFIGYAIGFLIFCIGTRVADFSCRITEAPGPYALDATNYDARHAKDGSQAAPLPASEGSAYTIDAVEGSGESWAVLAAFSDGIESEARDDYRTCVVGVIAAMLRDEHENRPTADIDAYVGPAIEAADANGIDPALLVAVGYRESRLTPVIGDRGNACGAWQYHVRYLDSVDSGFETVDDACIRMQVDPTAAAEAAAERLARYPHVCHYNQGNRCNDRDLRGEVGTYSAHVHGYRDRIEAACGVAP